MTHSLDSALGNWPTGAKGLLITDALDAVRNPDANLKLRGVLGETIGGTCGWTVIASVREFDLRHGRELRALFPGVAVEDFSEPDLANVSHFYLKGFRDSDLEHLSSKRSDIRQIWLKSQSRPKTRELFRSPFCLRIAAALLSAGANPNRLADWSTPGLLLGAFWQLRLDDSGNQEAATIAMQKICQRMVEERRLTLSAKELYLTREEAQAIRYLRSAGVLQSSKLRYGFDFAEELIEFSHHLLHDFAIARTLIPGVADALVRFAQTDRVLAVLYRQSFLFALDEVWDRDQNRLVFWETTCLLEDTTTIPLVSRIMAPGLGANRTESLNDLLPLLDKIRHDQNKPQAGSQRALMHLALGLQDVDPVTILQGSDGWTALLSALSKLLPGDSALEAPITYIVSRLIETKSVVTEQQRRDLNLAARALLKFHLRKPAENLWFYPAYAAIEGICQTFSASSDSESSLLELVLDQRSKSYRHEELLSLSRQLEFLTTQGKNVILALYSRAFGFKSRNDKWENFGGVVLPMRIRLSDQWKSLQYNLACFYEKSSGLDAELMTRIAAVVANAYVTTDVGGERPDVLGSFRFQGRSVTLLADLSHLWIGRSYVAHESAVRIVHRFEEFLDGFAASADNGSLARVLDIFIASNRTAWLWSVFFNVGTNKPHSLGAILAPVLSEPTFLCHPDYAFPVSRLIGTVHAEGDEKSRSSLERILLDLPHAETPWLKRLRGKRKPFLRNTRDRLLGALEEKNLVLPLARKLWRQQKSAATSISPPTTSHPPSEPVLVKAFTDETDEGLTDSKNQSLGNLLNELSSLCEGDQNVLTQRVEQNWNVFLRIEKAARLDVGFDPKLLDRLRTTLVELCRNLVLRGGWPQDSNRWQLVQRVLLRAASDPLPKLEGSEADEVATVSVWGPRTAAADALPILPVRLGKLTRSVEKVLRQLTRDPHPNVRCHLAQWVYALHPVAPDLMWEILDSLIGRSEPSMVLFGILASLNQMIAIDPKMAQSRILTVVEEAKDVLSGSPLYEQMALILTLHWIQTGEPRCLPFLERVVANCETAAGARVLRMLQHHCRDSGFLTLGYAQSSLPKAIEIQKRTWSFLALVLNKAKARLRVWADRWSQRGPLKGKAFQEHRAAVTAIVEVIDGTAAQLYFASGAFDENTNKLMQRKLQRDYSWLNSFWLDAAPLLRELASEWHPHVIFQLVQTLNHLLPCAPKEVFLIASQAIKSSAAARFQYDSMAVKEVVHLVEQILADHRNLFDSKAKDSSACLDALLAILDLFAEAGWPEARKLTNRLQEIYR